MEHSGLGSAMWVFGTRSSHFLYRKPRPEVAPHGATLEPDTGAYSAAIRRSDGAMRGGDGESSSAPLTVW